MVDEQTSVSNAGEPAQPAKKPYVKPQLHLLSGMDAEGKAFGSPVETTRFTGPS